MRTVITVPLIPGSYDPPPPGGPKSLTASASIVNNKWPENEFYDLNGFVVRVQWQTQAQEFAGQVFNADRFNQQPIEGATIDIEWLDQSTLQVIVDIPGDQVDVAEVRTELYVYITDDDGGFVYERSDVAIWKADL